MINFQNHCTSGFD